MKRLLGLAALAGLGTHVARRTAALRKVDPSLRANPLVWVGLPMRKAAVRSVMRAVGIPSMGTPKGVDVETRHIPGPAGDLRVIVHRPHDLAPDAPALLWIHGGGMIIGDPSQDTVNCAAYAAQLGAVVVATSYRLAPENPFPAAPEDCYAAWFWLVEHASELGVDPTRMAIGGASAGGGLAAILAQLIQDRGIQSPVLQLLVYPMLDDRTNLRTDHGVRGEFVWTPAENRFGWDAFIGSADPSAGAVPARREDLSGLPPAWIGVGDLDLFHDEDVDYARRLREAGVAVELVVVPRAYHAFDLVRGAEATKAFWRSQVDTLRDAFGSPGDRG